MDRKQSQDIDVHTTETGFKYHRGSALSVFKSDRREDIMEAHCAPLSWTEGASRRRLDHEPATGCIQPRLQPNNRRPRQGRYVHPGLDERTA